MTPQPGRAWEPLGRLLRSPPLFWRTFLLIVALAVASLAAWVPTVRVVERVPRAHQLAEQVISIIDATRIALVYSDPDRRRELLADLLENESLRVIPFEPTDHIEPMNDSALLRLVEREVRQRLGSATRLASAVNGVRGFWVSFAIEDDVYWVYIERDLLRRDIGNAWIAWAVLATALSLLVAIAITRAVNRPLAVLSRAAAELGAGRVPAPLPDSGPVEIRAVNRNFNRMVSDLDKLAQDRAVLLAGVSHDLRTPLTRMRLELEMSELPEAGRNAMIGDLDQMDRIVRQFLDYARPSQQREAQDLDLSALLREALARNRLLPPESAPEATATGTTASPPAEATAELAASQLQLHVEPGVIVRGHATELARTLDNLLGNALRYGRSEDGRLELQVELRREATGEGGSEAVLLIADHGPGVPAEEMARVLRPFERGDAARSGTTGAGLGLAIVERVLQQHGARLRLEANEPSGLRVRIDLPARPSPAAPAQAV